MVEERKKKNPDVIYESGVSERGSIVFDSEHKNNNDFLKI